MTGKDQADCVPINQDVLKLIEQGDIVLDHIILFGLGTSFVF